MSATAVLFTLCAALMGWGIFATAKAAEEECRRRKRVRDIERKRKFLRGLDAKSRAEYDRLAAMNEQAKRGW